MTGDIAEHLHTGRTGLEKLNEYLDSTGRHCRNRKIKPGDRLVLHMIDTAMQQAERPWQLGKQCAGPSGRPRDHLKILPAAFVVVGDTVEEAKAKRAHLDSLVHYANAVGSLSIALGHDASGFDPDGPLPEITDTNASKSSLERTVNLARRENLTVRQLAQRLGGYAGLAFVGTPETIADEMQQWLEEEGSDGFNVMFPYLPEGLDDFVEKVVPELQRRGIFRTEYEGRTLRDNLGLQRPANRFF